jgi:signal transduction histidine kinase
VDTIKLEIKKSDDRLALKVIDQGQGISQDDMTSIFDPFYRSDKARSHEAGGFGLGLSICKAIVEAHGGSISVVSQITKGSVFTISLPKQKSP